MAIHNDTGKWGEQAACDILTAQGYTIRDRNWHQGHLELDIIASKGNEMVFGEVKTRTNPDEDPLEAINSRKIANIVRAARAYMLTLNELPVFSRFDVFAVRGTEEEHSIEHIPDAFNPPVKTYR